MYSAVFVLSNFVYSILYIQYIFKAANMLIDIFKT